MQYLSSESSKLQSSDMVFSTVYVLILEQLLVQKILYFLCLYGMWQSLTFQIIYKRPLSRSFLDRGVILWDWIAHVIKYLQLQWNSLFFFYGFLSCAHFSFVYSQMFWSKLVFTLTNCVLKHKNDVLKKTRLSKLYIC